MKDKRKFLFICMIFAASTTQAQHLSLEPAPNKDLRPFLPSLHVSYFYNTSQQSAISPDFYSKNLGFFCRQELKLQSATGMPIKLRLGTVQYCDWMEGKKTAGLTAPR